MIARLNIIKIIEFDVSTCIMQFLFSRHRIFVLFVAFIILLKHIFYCIFSFCLDRYLYFPLEISIFITIAYSFYKYHGSCTVSLFLLLLIFEYYQIFYSLFWIIIVWFICVLFVLSSFLVLVFRGNLVEKHKLLVYFYR